jgi:hypothetical protein
MMNEWIFILSAMLILAVLFGPYTLRIHFVKTGPSSDALVRMRSVGDLVGLDWLSDGSDSSLNFILFRKALRISGKGRELPETEDEAAGDDSNRPSGENSLLNARRLRVIFKVGSNALGKIIRVFHLERAGVNIRFGTGNPATTGMLFGFMQTLISVPRTGFAMDIAPDFVRRKLEGEADLTLRFTMLRLAAVLITVLIRAVFLLRQS